MFEILLSDTRTTKLYRAFYQGVTELGYSGKFLDEVIATVDSFQAL